MDVNEVTMEDLENGVLTPENFPHLTKYGQMMTPVDLLPVGREEKVDTIRATFKREELNNALLLGPAGVGKTSFMKGFATKVYSLDHRVFDSDLATMAGEGDNKFAERLKGYLDEAIKYEKLMKRINPDSMLVLFFDEMHLITMNGHGGRGGGTMAGNALKPIMTNSGIRIVGATTDEEYNRYIKPDKALERRLQPLHLEEPNNLMTEEILINFANKHLGKTNVPFIMAKNICKEIVYYTNSYMPSFAQPAKSIDILDAAIGFYKTTYEDVTSGKLDKKVLMQFINHDLIAKIFRNKIGVDVDFKTETKTVMDEIRKTIMGQDMAVSAIEDTLYTANAGLQSENKPQASFLFVGSTGVGKTALAKKMAETMFGSERNMIRYDMSEYPQPEDAKLFQERLAEDISNKAHSVVLFDEIEKAHRSIMHMLLAILDDGRLTDEFHRQVTFNNAIIIATTNAAADTFREIRKQNLTVEGTDVLLRDTLSNYFSPEFIGRFDKLAMFSPLEEDVFNNITKLTLKVLKDRVFALHGIDLIFDDRVLPYLVKERFNALTNTSAGGARAVKKRVNEEITSLVARCIDFARSKDKNLGFIRIDVDGIMAIEDKTKAVTDSRLVANVVTLDGYESRIFKTTREPIFEKIKEQTNEDDLAYQRAIGQ